MLHVLGVFQNLSCMVQNPSSIFYKSWKYFIFLRHPIIWAVCTFLKSMLRFHAWQYVFFFLCFLHSIKTCLTMRNWLQWVRSHMVCDCWKWTFNERLPCLMTFSWLMLTAGYGVLFTLGTFHSETLGLIIHEEGILKIHWKPSTLIYNSLLQWQWHNSVGQHAVPHYTSCTEMEPIWKDFTLLLWSPNFKHLWDIWNQQVFFTEPPSCNL